MASRTAPPIAPSRSPVDRAVDAAVGHMLGIQHAAGYWWAELESNVTITAEHVFLRHVLGCPDPDEAGAAARYILSRQRIDGTWSNWYEGPGELSTSIEAYTCLKMAGIAAERPEMVSARAFIMGHGGLERARVFTKIWLAMMGAWDWDRIPRVPPEIVLLPSRLPISIYAFGCWARQTIVPLSIVMDRKPVVSLPPSARIDELVRTEQAEQRIPPSRRSLKARLFIAADRLARRYDRLPWKPLRDVAIRRARRWILERQEADGSWGGIQPPWVYSLIALQLLGDRLDGDGPLARGFRGFYGPRGFAVENEEGFHLQSCLSPVWDTGLALAALDDAGLPSDHPARVCAGRWLLDEQVFDGGDWQLRCQARPGGWAFEFDNDRYPDTDDTAVVAMALRNIDLEPKRRQHAVDRALEWLLGMQSSNGGWGAFDRNNTRTWPREIPFADFGEMIDPPSVDVTGHVLECLGRFGSRIGERPVDRAVAFVKREQEEDGAWFGRWGSNLTYGIGCVLPGLTAVGETMSRPYVRRAVDWLCAHQNDDGGWGERVEGYDDPRWRGRGPSTASQTAWALLGMVAAGEAEHPATERGIAYLVRTQNDRGGWDEPYFTGTGFPTDFMIRYHLYRDVFPLMALGRYRRARTGAA